MRVFPRQRDGLRKVYNSKAHASGYHLTSIISTTHPLLDLLLISLAAFKPAKTEKTTPKFDQTAL